MCPGIAGGLYYPADYFLAGAVTAHGHDSPILAVVGGGQLQSMARPFRTYNLILDPLALEVGRDRGPEPGGPPASGCRVEYEKPLLLVTFQ